MTRLSLGEYALRLAEAAAQRSEDPKRQVGACVLDARGRVLSLGYNGPPSGIDLTEFEWDNHKAKDMLTVHAEANALRYVQPGAGVLLASTYGPCSECVKAAASQGIETIVYRTPSAESMLYAEALAFRLGLEMNQIINDRVQRTVVWSR